MISAADYSKLEQTLFNRIRLRQLAVVVIGAGALGNEVTRILGLLGAACVSLIDPDVVEANNLPRSFLFWGQPAIGRSKAYALRDAAAALFPDTDWRAIDKEIADVGFQQIASADLLFSCVDSDLARLEIAYISNKLRIPMVDGGLGRQNHCHGRVTYFPGIAGTACFGCMLSPRTRRELLELWRATLRPCSPEAGLGEDNLVSTPTMAAVVGAIQVDFGLRNFYGTREGAPAKSTTLEVRLGPERRMSEFTTPASDYCPFHEWAEQTLHPLPRPECTIEEFLNHAAAECLVLDWPICVEAECLVCRKRWPPMLRLAALRRRGSCPFCGSKSFLELQTIRDIGRGSTWAGRMASALGLPRDHLYTLQLSSSLP